MRRIDFSKGWKFTRRSVNGMPVPLQVEEVTLPHDAAISLAQRPDMPGGADKGYYPDSCVSYGKTFRLHTASTQNRYLLHFEGAYRNAIVYINGDFAGRWQDGYTGFQVDITPNLRINEENSIVVDCSSAADSRWYTGTGLYRTVELWELGPVHIVPESLRLTTLSADEEIAVILLEAELCNDSNTSRKVELLTAFDDISCDRRCITLAPRTKEQVSSRIYLRNPRRWSPDTPFLYDVSVCLKENELVLDSEKMKYGIRTLSLDNVRGLSINGKRILLNGGCVHHSNGLVGAASFRAAEYRKARIMKESGFNAVRSSHNHCSRFFLEACDHYGLLVMDELSDVWDLSKSPADISFSFSDIWRDILDAMIREDYNHPSVILYSIGNEIKEVGMDSGRRWARKLCQAVRSRDSSRYVTCAINGLITLMGGPSLPESSQTPEEINALMAGMSKMMSMMSQIQCSESVVDATRELAETLDVVGYNYAEDKQLLDMSLFPNWICVGSETFARSFARNWQLVKDNPAVLGDFVWSAWDYLGEAGIGAGGELADTPKVGLYQGFPYRTASCGDIDITGHRRPQSYYREITAGIRKRPYICVENPLRYNATTDRTPWSWTDGENSWSLCVEKGTPVHVEVYGRGSFAELFLNGNLLAKKEVPQTPGDDRLPFCTVFDVAYIPGTLLARVTFEDGHTEEEALVTAGRACMLSVVREEEALSPSDTDIVFYRICVTDENKIVTPYEEKRLTIIPEAGTEVVAFGSANPLSQTSFAGTTADTFYGRASAALRAVSEDGEIRAVLHADGCRPIVIHGAHIYEQQ